MRHCLPLLLATLATCAHADWREDFAHPAPAKRPTLRYWLPGAEVDLKQVDQDLSALAKAGFGAVEIADVALNVGQQDPARYGWGSAAWREVLTHTAESAARQGLGVSLTVGPAWPAVVPGLDPDSPAAAHELVAGWQSVAPGASFKADAPQPQTPASPGIHKADLIAVQAWRCVDACQEQPIRLRAGSRQALGKASTLDWHAPKDGQWLVIAFWSRGFAEVSALSAVPSNPAPSAPQAYVPDHFADAGAGAITDYWDQHLLTDRLRKVLRQSGRELFEDSLELEARRHWTATLPQAFAERRGYALEPWLPLLMVDTRHQFGAPLQRTPAFVLDNPDSQAASAYHDYLLTLSDLYRDHHLAPLQRWAKNLGLGLRAQPYGMPMDMGAAAEQPDVPEAENLSLGNQPDLLRLLATGGQIAGRPLLSSECCSELNRAYRQSWLDMLRVLHLHYASGVNQLTLHGMAYGGPVANARWPGWSPFAPFGPSVFSPKVEIGFSEAWGPRQPTWPDMPVITGHLARSQWLLRQGQAQIDVAVLDDRLDHDGPILANRALEHNGYSLGFISTAQIRQHGLTWRNGLLHMGQAQWRALQVNGPVDAATERLLQNLAAQGAPILRGDDALPSFKPAAQSDSPDVRSVHRVNGQQSFYWLTNLGDKPYNGPLTLRGEGQLWALDTWSGASHALAVQREGDSLTTAVELAPGQTLAFAISPGTAPTTTHRWSPNRQPVGPWKLSLESWHPAADGITTRHDTLPTRTTALEAWAEPLSGRARYSTHLTLPAGTQAIRLELPAMGDFWQLRVNGKPWPVDPFARTVEIDRDLKSGDNLIEVAVATTLESALRVSRPELYGALPAVGHGLVGEVWVQNSVR